MYRVVLTDRQNGPKSGAFKEILGSYNPHANEVQLKADRISHWLSVGAQASGTVHNLLVSEGIVKGDKKNVLPKKTPIVSEKEEEAQAPEATPEETASEEASETPAEESVEEEKVEEKTEEPADETPVEETASEEEPKEEAPEAPAEESAPEEGEAEKKAE